MALPDGIKFTKEHEWLIQEEEGIATIGISDFAQESLGDITFAQLPELGTELSKDDTFGVVESVKAVSDLYAPVTGKVIDVNQTVLDAPELLNEDPYEEGWLIKMEFKDPSELDELMDTEQYSSYVEESN